MILIADSGATKTSWAAICGDDVLRFSGEGCNPNFTDAGEMVRSIGGSIPEKVRREEVSEIHFYCAGIGKGNSGAVTGALGKVFPAASIWCGSDLLGAARALLGHNAGFAAILGTGANTCIYDGTGISQHVDCMGFILGDEGSGAYIGKRLICDYLRGNMPENVRLAAGKAIGLDRDGIIERIYRLPHPNRFCASLCRFVGENIGGDPYFSNLVKDSFRAFFNGMVCRYGGWRSMELNCTGSVAYVFRGQLAAVAGEFGMKTGIIEKEPLDGLISYHRTTK